MLNDDNGNTVPGGTSEPGVRIRAGAVRLRFIDRAGISYNGAGQFWENREGFRRKMLRGLGRCLVRTFLFLFTRFEVSGQENIPRRGAVLVCANHLSLADPPVVGVCLGRPAVFMAKEELFRSAFSGYFVARLGAFPVRRGRLDREAIRRAEKVLSKGGALAMFPEGTRSAGSLQEGFGGAALIALRTGVPVVPVGITGTEKMKGWGWMLHRPKVTVRIGVPFHLPASHGETRRTEVARCTGIIMSRIAALLPDKYRGAGARS